MKTRMKLLVALLALAAGPAFAATATGNLSVTATVAAACSVATTTVAFGTYDPTSATDDDDGVGEVEVTCTNGTTYIIELGNGLYYSSGRRMRSSTTTYEYLGYALYQNADRDDPWGSGTDAMTGLTGNGSAQEYPVYGRATAGQFVKADSYADTVVVTVTFPAP